MRAHLRRVSESTGTNAPGTAFTSSDLRGESIGYQPVFDVGVLVHTYKIRVPKERYVTVSIPKREKKISSVNQGVDGDESHTSSDEAAGDKDRKKKKGLTRNYLDTV